MRIPGQELQRLLMQLPAMHASSLTSRVYRAAACLVRVPETTIRAVFRNVKNAAWNLLAPDASVRDVGKERQDAEDEKEKNKCILRILVREALSASVNGRSDEEFMRTLMRLRLHGLDIGQKYHSREFVKLAEHLGASLIRMLDAADLHEALPGHGLQSCFGISFDIGSLDRSLFSKHESLVAVAINFVSPATGELHGRCFLLSQKNIFCYLAEPGFRIYMHLNLIFSLQTGFGCPSTGGSHQGQRQADLVLQALESHPASITKGVLQARLACTGGDGAVVRGGPEARHSSSAAAHLLWRKIRDDQEEGLTLWGHFHRSDRALHFASTKWVEEVLDMGRELNRLFGVNAGKVGLCQYSCR